MTQSISVEIDEHAEIVGVLAHAQRAIFQHPVAAQAIFAALVAEGRAFSKTVEGAAWQERLADSPLLEKAQAVWEGLTLNVLEENATTVVPSRILDVFVKLLHERSLDAVLRQLNATRL